MARPAGASRRRRLERLVDAHRGFSHKKKGQFFCLDASHLKTRRSTVADTPTWAHLAVVGDGILVKDAGSLAYLRF